MFLPPGRFLVTERQVFEAGKEMSMHETRIIRHEEPGDGQTISKILYAAFKDHPQHPPGVEPNEHLMVEKLRQTGNLTLSLVAEDTGEPAGYIAMSPVSVGDAATGWYLLGPVGVVPGRQKTGIGTALIREALQKMRKKGALGIVLVGDPAFYNRFGFMAVPGLVYKGVPDRYVLGLAFTGILPRGEIVAHEAFGVS
jgi:putative acetyltransferase